MAQARLTTKERMFALEYIICKNGTEAARRAGYQGDDNVLAVTAHTNLRKPKIKNFIEAHFAETAMRANEVISRLSEEAAGDMGDFIKVEHGLPFFDLEKARARNKLHLIKSFQNTKQGVKLELYDAQAAQKLLAQYHGLLKTNVEINLSDDALRRFLDIAQRAEIPASELFEQMLNALASELTAGSTDGDSESSSAE